MHKRQLVLEDGSVFIGEGFGSTKDCSGEVVFNTGMTGYQEVISDPSYCGQIVMMTYPLVGNYGINRDDFETVTPFIHGFIVKEYCEHPSNFRSDESLSSFLQANDIPGIAGIDTRKLTKIIRLYGTMKGCITSCDEPVEKVIERLKQTPKRTNQVHRTSTAKPYVVPGRGLRIVLVDFGMKHGILRELTKHDCHVTVVPYNYGASNILRLKPDGIMLTNGPGDPKDVPEAIEMLKEVLGRIPLFGICLGHQLLALACGANTEKMKFGHRGANHPVKDLEKGKTYMTSQNHSYAVTHESLGRTNLALTQIALNDNSVEGIRHTVHPAFSVQYHPESSPGPEDTNHLFDEFLQMIVAVKAKNEEEAYA
ncbi:glutamine-hydrolyzing carbamoyl-phosphate synthase small subunit [Virgibacillus dakarensis]|uniref:Carbamoyl phosphate synthase small chain n=1 Tax=Lentibacillus populi TaxID=1827502 RepID=A0A9W5X681_9BACI|nr:carbamoyl phosphate synthase small subunit [Lentibacillus populi]MBT2216913.1 carbamoyl phosphate synthase small subunit [Virgibacillus dakarensis]MTW85319.1 glutamine-hydrolyzing carbamoyl-phosphate synthase small subunit [Virgibacillus dakarensis]GGB45334.1 carbamoyl-phosphate synthase pyrimidine-specific small chain [Lentibacillus populi]